MHRLSADRWLNSLHRQAPAPFIAEVLIRVAVDFRMADVDRLEARTDAFKFIRVDGEVHLKRVRGSLPSSTNDLGADGVATNGRVYALVDVVSITFDGKHLHRAAVVQNER